MKVLLINPPFNSFSATQPPEVLFPLGLGYLGAALMERTSVEVGILDTVVSNCECQPNFGGKSYNFGMRDDEIERKIREFDPDLVGITCAFTKRWKNTLKVAGIVKKIDPSIRVLVGGAHPSAFPEECLTPEVDCVVAGEGENAIVDAISDGKTQFMRYSYISQIDEIPFPSRSLVDMKPYLKGERDNFITSRGCPYSCTYCSIHCVWGRKWRARSPKNVVDEVEQCVKRYGVRVASFMDDNMTLDRERMIGICKEMMKRGVDVWWNIPNGTSVAHLDQELIAYMKASGCYAVNLAVESGSEKILHDSMNKHITLRQVERVAEWCKDAGLLTLGYFILGMPGETLETMKETLKFAEKIELDCVNVLIATPYPGTALYETCEKEGWLKTLNFDDYTAFDPVIETPLLSANDVYKFARDFREDYDAWYNSRHSPPTQYIKDAIRRPNSSLIANCLERRFRS